MDNPVAQLLKDICLNLLETADTKSNKQLLRSATSVINLHADKLNILGDVSILRNLIVWQRFLDKNEGLRFCQTILELLQACPDNAQSAAACEKLVTASANWMYPVERLQMRNGRIIVYLQRTVVIKQLMQLVLLKQQNYGKLNKDSRKSLQLLPLLQHPEDDKLTFHRAKLLHKVLNNVLQHSAWTLVNAVEETKLVLQVQVASVAQLPNEDAARDNNYLLIKCGIVKDANTGKVATTCATEYNSLRARNMLLLARHKHGIRLKCDANFMALVDRLGEAAVTVDLLEVKHSSPVHAHGPGSTKGAAFILYNSARLETLLRTFETKVKSGIYPALPACEEIDFTLLKEEEEWQLIYAYVFAYPQLIESSLERLQEGIVATHMIVRFLSNLVATFSVYYRRVRILAQSRSHANPELFARIYLLKIVRIVLNSALALLDIAPVMFM